MFPGFRGMERERFFYFLLVYQQHGRNNLSSFATALYSDGDGRNTYEQTWKRKKARVFKFGWISFEVLQKCCSVLEFVLKVAFCVDLLELTTFFIQ